ncbi:hypothetical protein [Noviherbaspirillum aridicola]|uniref:MFS transporter n=1 Tax=Noviherbaspirillum aridicola TaxID=2849687 RepID=A0ABQ4Q716_9BURK|nr:hypothetical protein [Noviherbaspirillum aridicola]GIZ53026.1 hypothetical protein NCCP691_30400 [Noviherbaspirillum aridicola]
MTPNQRAILPLIGLQGAVGSLGGFIGFFVVGRDDVHAIFRYSAAMLTVAMLATFLAYRFGPRLKLSGARLLRLGFVVPGLLLLFGDGSVATMAIAFGSYLGLTWGGRHALEMALLDDGERDTYAACSCTAVVVLGVAMSLLSTLLLAASGEQARFVYWLYGALCLLGALLLGRAIPDTGPVSLQDPVSVLRQPQFIACLPLFFLESGLFGIGQAMHATGAARALASASHFGWVSTCAGLVGGLALYFTRRRRDVDNRAQWLGLSCLVVGAAFVLLGASAWLPGLFVAYSILKAAGSPFLLASEQVLNQRTLDIHGALPDRIFARELVLWGLRMLSLCLFWVLSVWMTPFQMLVTGAAVLSAGTALEYVVGKALLGQARSAPALASA